MDEVFHDTTEKLIPFNKGLYEDLISLGFDRTIAKNAIELYPDANFKVVYDLLSRNEEEKWNHEFIFNENDNKICKLCKEGKDSHFLFDQKSKEYFEAIKKSKVEETNEDAALFPIDNCEICFNSFSPEEKAQAAIKCGHLYCTSCWEKYIKAEIGKGNTKIKCINEGCKYILKESEISRLCQKDKNIFSLYKTKLEEKKIIENPDIKNCPIKNCNSLLHLKRKPILFGFFSKEKKNRFFIKCGNGHKICFNCLKIYHKGSCSTYYDSSILEKLKNKDYRLCPSCGVVIERNQGCPHIKCASCKYEWCWVCLERYYIGHFGKFKCNKSNWDKDKKSMKEQVLERPFEKKWYYYFEEYYTGQVAIFIFLFGIIYIQNTQVDRSKTFGKLLEFFKVFFLSLLIEPLFIVFGVFIYAISIFYPPFVNLVFLSYEEILRVSVGPKYERVDEVRNILTIERIKPREFDFYLGESKACKNTFLTFR